MSEIFLVSVKITKVTDTPAVKNRYGDVESPASTVRLGLLEGEVAVENEGEVRDRVSSMLDAAGIVFDVTAPKE